MPVSPTAAPAPSLETAPPMGFYALQPSAHVDYAMVPSPFYFSHLIKVHLTPEKYLSWCALLLPLLWSHYLEGYVDGSLPCPPPSHPAYHTWVAWDQAILSAIQSSLTMSVSSMVLFASTSWDHSFKNRTGDRTGEAIGFGFYRSDHWFTSSQSGFLSYNLIYFTYKYCNK
jgi:hypothetical protein